MVFVAVTLPLDEDYNAFLSRYVYYVFRSSISERVSLPNESLFETSFYGFFLKYL